LNKFLFYNTVIATVFFGYIIFDIFAVDKWRGAGFVIFGPLFISTNIEDTLWKGATTLPDCRGYLVLKFGTYVSVRIALPAPFLI